MPSKRVVSNPATLAAASTPWPIVATNGTAIVEVIIQTCLPFSFDMSKGAPGAMNTGFCIAFSTSALASASPSARAAGESESAPTSAANALAKKTDRKCRSGAPECNVFISTSSSLVISIEFCLKRCLSRQAACSRATKRANVTAISNAAPLNISCTHEEVPKSSRPVTPVTRR